ncbi:WG repeat-containing protein [Chitinophaga eiseniae]|uniref:WG repeat-containing protein n=1 Tax=Chitinophaga eiseniae TaxID=634771 RepID=A0A847SRE9_9BACT|nr:WG repeat-containing protein [Chitinophaga eiseniae]NLR82145.1 WG repeat-containing protein [Chitinophaga eiseniae]
MQYMKRISCVTFAVVLLAACKVKTEPSEELKAFVKQFDGKTLVAAKEELQKESERIDRFIKFMSRMAADKENGYTGKEDTVAPYQLRPVDVFTSGYAAYLENIGLTQEVKYPNSVLEANNALRDNDNYDLEAPDVISEKIFFADGTTEAKSYALDGSTPIPSSKTIDSVLATVSYSYPVKMTVLKLDKSHSTATFKGAAIKIDKMKDNQLRLLMGDSAYKNYLYIEAFNQDGKPLDYISRNNGSGHDPDDMNKLLKTYNNILQQLVKKIDNGHFKDIHALQEAMLDEMPGGTPFDAGKGGYTQGYYKGKVAGVRVYMAEARVEVKKEMMLKNLSPNYAGLYLVKDAKSDLYGFMDAGGKFVIPPTYKEMTAINPFFFSSSDYNGYYYYRLDTATRQLVKLDLVAREFSPQLAIVAKNEEGGLKGLMDGNGKLVIPMIYDDIMKDGKEPVFYANKSAPDGPLQGICSLYDYQGQLLTSVPYYTNGNTYSDGLLLVYDKSNHHYFLDNKGKRVIDLKEYQDVEPFEDGLAKVRNAHFDFGFINTHGQPVIPCMYATARPFNEGIAMVTKKVNNDTEVGLINTKNEVIVPFNAASYDIDGKGAKMVYTIGEKKYNAKGMLMQ